jgi:hypothetical protein
LPDFTATPTVEATRVIVATSTLTPT